jgi:putative ABC transport system permease protein
VAGLLLVGGFFGYIFWGFRETTINNGVGHLQIYNAQFFAKDETRTLEYGLDRVAEITAAAARTPHVRGMAPRIEFFGMCSNGLKSGTYMATAVVPELESKMGFRLSVVSGRDLAASGERNEAVLGSGLARSMSAKPGDSLTLLAVTTDGALNGIDIDVVGIASTRIKELDDRLLRMTLASAQRLLQTEKVTKLVVGLDRTESTPAVKAAFTGLGKDVAVKDWQELSPMYKQIVMMFGGILVFMAVVVLFMAVMSSANTLMMAMFERTREIGTMLAMGTPRSWVLGLFVFEGVLTGVLGAVSGVLLGNGAGWLLNHSGLQMPPPPGNTEGFAFRVQHEPALMIVASLLVILTMTAASVLPAFRASRVRIVEALAHV